MLQKKDNALKLLRIKITINTNLTIVYFLDTTLILKKDTFELNKKENNTPIYIYTSLNHLPSIIKHIPKSISCRISDSSSDIDIFNKNKYTYDNTLKNNSYKQHKINTFKYQTRTQKWKYNLVQPTIQQKLDIKHW